MFSRLGNFSEELSKMNQTNGSGLTKYVMSLFDDCLVWDDIRWLKRLLYNLFISIWQLILKQIKNKLESAVCCTLYIYIYSGITEIVVLNLNSTIYLYLRKMILSGDCHPSS
jgi:hypothetical protein